MFSFHGLTQYSTVQCEAMMESTHLCGLFAIFKQATLTLTGIKGKRADKLSSTTQLGRRLDIFIVIVISALPHLEPEHRTPGSALLRCRKSLSQQQTDTAVSYQTVLSK